MNRLRPAAYQLVPLTKILSNRKRCVMICDGVGVGKTISACYAITYLSLLESKPALVVCPPTLIAKWMGELEYRFGIKALPVRTREDYSTVQQETKAIPATTTPRTYVLSNSLLSLDELEVGPLWSLAVFDEIHSYRNRETILHAGAKMLALRSSFRMGLSATPINNALDDLTSELNILMPEAGWDALNASVIQLWSRERRKLTRPLVTRFVKEKLGIHFAKREVRTEYVSYPSPYYSRVRDILNKASRRLQTTFFETVTYYRMAASSPVAFAKALRISEKLVDDDPKMALLQMVLAWKKNERWLIFCEFEDTANFLGQMVKDRPVFILTGQTPMFEREAVVKQFSQTPGAVLVMTSIGSEGLDLQFCSSLVNYDLHWNPMRLEQRAGRIDRVGQTKTSITLVNFIVRGSIDERVLNVVRQKLKLISGSVFNVGSLVESVSAKSRIRERLFDSHTIMGELAATNALVKALKYSGQIPEEDYQVLRDISLQYCDVKRLQDAAQVNSELAWVKHSARTRRWLDGIKADSQNFTKLMEYYG